MKCTQLIVSCLLLQIHTLLFAEPLVIFDNGLTVDANQFYPFEQVKPADLLNHQYNISQTLQQFPVVTAEMNAGIAINHTMNHLIKSPVCVIGDDAMSLDWLKRHYQQLSEIGAVCFVVNVASKNRFDAIQNIGLGLKMMALPGADFYHRFGIETYPILIYQNTLSQ